MEFRIRWEWDQGQMLMFAEGARARFPPDSLLGAVGFGVASMRRSLSIYVYFSPPRTSVELGYMNCLAKRQKEGSSAWKDDQLEHKQKFLIQLTGYRCLLNLDNLHLIFLEKDPSPI